MKPLLHESTWTIGLHLLNHLLKTEKKKPWHRNWKTWQQGIILLQQIATIGTKTWNWSWTGNLITVKWLHPSSSSHNQWGKMVMMKVHECSTWCSLACVVVVFFFFSREGVTFKDCSTGGIKNSCSVGIAEGNQGRPWWLGRTARSLALWWWADVPNRHANSHAKTQTATVTAKHHHNKVKLSHRRRGEKRERERE